MNSYHLYILVDTGLQTKKVICYFFFNDTATTEIYTLSLHDALPILAVSDCLVNGALFSVSPVPLRPTRSEEHTSELQSRQYLVCRLLLEKKKQKINDNFPSIPTCSYSISDFVSLHCGNILS